MTTQPTSASHFERNLPEPILKKLRALVRRIRRVLLLRGLLATAAVALAALLAMMAIDATVVMTSLAPRLLLTLAGLVTVVAASVVFVVRPRRRKISLATIARIIETQHPELQERISSTVELRGGSEWAGAAAPVELPKGSEQLIAALTEEATLDAGRIEPRKEVSTRSIKPYLMSALALAGVMGLVFLIWPRHASLALTRVVAPVLNVGNVSAVDLEVKPGNRVVAIGDPVSIQVLADESDLPSAELQVIDITGYETRQKAEPTPAGEGRRTASWHFPAVMAGFQYRIRAGRALSEYYEIKAVPRPAIEAAELRYEYPAYTELEPKIVESIPPVVEALTGTKVTLQVASNVAIARPQFSIGGKELDSPAARQSENGRPAYAWTFPVSAETAGIASLVLEEEHGIASEPLEFEIKPIVDNPPKIVVEDPKAYRLTMKPRDRLTLKYRTEDDFGVGEIVMRVRIGRGEPLLIAQPIPPEVERPLLACQGDAILDLSQLDLGDAKQITVEMQVADTLPQAQDGPNRAASKPIVIEIDRTSPEAIAQQSQPPEMQLTEEERRQLQEMQEKAEQLEQLAEKQDQLADQAEAKPADQPPDAQWQQQEQKVAQEIAEAIKQDPQAMAGQLKADRQQANAMSQEAQRLAQQQDSLKEQATTASNAQADREKLKQEILDQLSREQKAIAEETSKLAAENQQSNPEASKELAAAEQEMSQAAQQMDQQQPANAAQEARAAQEHLEKAAAAPPQAEALADRQENVAQALEAVAKGDLEQALAEMQQDVAQQAEGLQQQAEQLAERAESLGGDQPMQQNAQSAAKELGEASQAAEKAAGAMEQKPSEAAPSQQQAGESLKEAAKSLADLGKQLGEKAEQLAGEQPQPSQQPAAEAMADAFLQATEAAQSQSSQQAAQAAREAAQSLAQAAQTTSQQVAQIQAKAQRRPQPGQMSKQGQRTNQPSQPGNKPSEKLGKLPPTPGSKMQPLAKPKPGDPDWAKFRGQVKGEAGARTGKDADDEYRDLVNRYFEELSRQGTPAGGK